jgi:hypothetical protein
LPHLTRYNRQVNTIAAMLNTKQKPLAPVVLKQRTCPTTETGGPPY